MEDLGFFPYPSSFSTGFDCDEILDPGPTSFFLKDPTGEDVLLAQGLDQLNCKLGLFEDVSNHSPINVDDDWLMRDLSSDVSNHTLDIPYTLDELQSDHGYIVENGILQDPNDLVEPIYPLPKKITKYEDDGYKCLVCNIALFRLKEVINHVLTVHCSKGEYLCTLCNTELPTVGAVKKHIKNVHFGFKPFQCPACKKSIQQKSHLKIHIDKQHGGKKGLLKKALAQHNTLNNKPKPTKSSIKDDIQCHLCHKNFLSEETKEKHLSTFHKVNPIQNNPMNNLMIKNEASLDCPVCHITLDSLESKKDHVKNVHHNLRTFECSKCPSMFHSQLHLKAHKMVHHQVGNLSNKIICDYHNCKMPMKSLKNLLSHVEDYHAYQCPECPRHLQTTSGLAKHYKKAHISNELLCCTYCGNCYKDEKELSHHVKEKHLNNLDSTTESSDIESQTMNDSKSLLVEKIMHPDVLQSIKKSVAKLAKEHRGRIPCEYCRANETFKTEADVLEHVKNMHPIQCPDCPLKMFKYPTSVRKHFKKFHGNETPYFCKTCTLVFKSADAVQIHMENEHGIANVVVVNQSNHTSPIVKKNELKIKCIVCGLKFETAQALAEHRSENHFYKCGDCDKEYKLTDSLRKHVKVTHNENVTMTCCKYCDKVFLDPSQKNGHLINYHPDVAPPSLNDSIQESKQIEVLQPIKSSFTSVKQEDKIASFKCPKCPKTYNIGKSLRKHCRKNHNKLSICFCHHCPKVFVTVSQRDLHIRREHPNMSLSNSPTHDHHHNGTTTKLRSLKPQSPTSPTSSASSPNNTPRIIVVKSPNKSPGLTTILKKVEVIQPQKCPHCQEFISNMKAHVCELPWACKLCGKTYKLSSGLRKHCREGHGILVAVCESCQITFMDGISGLEEHNREIHSRGNGRSLSSSPETFHGFTTPTKELEMTKRFETIILNLSDI